MVSTPGLASLILGTGGLLVGTKYLLDRKVFVPTYYALRKALNKEKSATNSKPVCVATEDASVIDKFCKAAWHLALYTLLWIWGISLYSKQSWAYVTANFWKGWPHSETEQLELAPFYFAETAFYVQAFIVSVTTERYRTDFAVIVLHHVVTLLLLVGSWVCGFHRIGLTVCVVQDIGDVFLYFCKFFHYTCDNRVLHAIGFSVMAVVFFATRVVILAVIVWSCFAEPEQYMQVSLAAEVLRWSMAILLVMQCFWFVMILKVAKGLLLTRKVLDPVHDSAEKAREYSARNGRAASVEGSKEE